MYPHHVFDLEPAGTFRMYPICYWRVSGGYLQPEPAMYSRCFRWFPGPLAPSVLHLPLKFRLLRLCRLIDRDILRRNWFRVQRLDITGVRSQQGIDVLESPESGVTSPRTFAVLI